MTSTMKRATGLLAVLAAAILALALAVPAWAQTVGTATPGTGSITISNAANGETYAVYKLFDATNSTAQTEGVSDSIAYTGTIPDSLSDYFTKDTAGNITATDAAKANDGGLTAEAAAALKAWVETDPKPTAQASVISDGSALTFQGLPYGYYVVSTTQGDTAVSVDSTNPNASVIDKNTTPPINNATKTADDDDVFIGQTVTYTVSFDTANYSTESGSSKQIVKYIIQDDFADGVLTNINVTSIKVGGTALTLQQFNNGTIEIPWVDANSKSLYANGATLEITYTATVANSAAIDGAGNTNTVTLDYKDVDGGGSPSEHKVTETIYTYAIAIKKVDQSGSPLAGAKFQLPFYVNATADTTDGAYVYAGTTEGDGLVNELTTPDNGLIIVKGVEQGTYSLTETEAPNGYNKLAADVEVTATKTGKTTTSTTTYLDKDGNVVNTQTEGGSTVIVSIEELSAGSVVVVNKTGVELPSTGGIGTTIFYVIGGILIAVAAIFLITRKRVANARKEDEEI